MEQKITELLDKLTGKLGAMEPTALEAFNQAIAHQMIIYWGGVIVMLCIIPFSFLGVYKLWKWYDTDGNGDAIFCITLAGTFGILFPLAFLISFLAKALNPLASLFL